MENGEDELAPCPYHVLRRYFLSRRTKEKTFLRMQVSIDSAELVSESEWELDQKDLVVGSWR